MVFGGDIIIEFGFGLLLQGAGNRVGGHGVSGGGPIGSGTEGFRPVTEIVDSLCKKFTIVSLTLGEGARNRRRGLLAARLRHKWTKQGSRNMGQYRRFLWHSNMIEEGMKARDVLDR